MMQGEDFYDADPTSDDLPELPQQPLNLGEASELRKEQ